MKSFYPAKEAAKLLRLSEKEFTEWTAQMEIRPKRLVVDGVPVYSASQLVTFRRLYRHFSGQRLKVPRKTSASVASLPCACGAPRVPKLYKCRACSNAQFREIRARRIEHYRKIGLASYRKKGRLARQVKLGNTPQRNPRKSKPLEMPA